MIVAIAQPENLPWLGYFNKMYKSQIFVFLDNVQFKKRYFENRNKIRTKEGQKWLTIPVKTKARFYQKIKDVLIDNSQDWQKKHWLTICHVYKKAPYFNKYAPFFEYVYKKKWQNLVEFNIAVIRYIAEQLNLERRFKRTSELSVEGSSTELLLNICKYLKASTYLSGKSGRNYLDENRFVKEGIAVTYQDFKHPVYKQLYNPFIPGMSVIDLLFNCGEKSIEIIVG